MAEAGAEHYFRFEAGTEIAENSRHCDHRRRSLGARGSDEPRAFERAEDLLNSKRRRSVSCLIADVQMPGMTGLELHDRLVTLGKPIPTILITAFHNESVGSALCRPVWLVISPNRSVRRTCSPVFVRFSDALTRVVRNRGFGMIGALRRVIAAPKANSDEGYGVAAWLCTSSTRPTCAETLLLKHRSRQHRRRGSLAIDLGDDTRPPRRSTANRDLETIESHVALMARLPELATAICWESDEFVEIEGAARAPASERPL